ncbi:AMP-binding protein [Paenibacillus ferrarius]|uniref:AMP-binding protein n=1 Tax=Paenibacillus ferrarius TaxID=1469647 RepID=UPI003D27FCB4
MKGIVTTLLKWLYPLLRMLLLAAFRVNVKGRERFRLAENMVLIPNHVSLLDGVLLSLVLPKEAVFVVNTGMAKRFDWLFPIRETISVDPANPYGVRSMLKTIRSGKPLVIFPEGRITTTGAMMKVYSGIGYMALRAKVTLVPVAINGLEYAKFSYLAGKVKQRWFPRVDFSFGEPFQVPPGMVEGLSRKAQKAWATTWIRDRMLDHLLESRLKPQLNLFHELLAAKGRHGAGRVILEDVVTGTTLTYRQLVLHSYVLAFKLKGLLGQLPREARTAIVLPNASAHVLVLFSLFRLGKPVVILNYSAGAGAMLDACETGGVRTVVTSRAFVEKIGLQAFVELASERYEVLFLETIRASVTGTDRLLGWLQAKLQLKGPAVGASKNEVVLFTSGSESKPKGVVLSHRNLFANMQQAKLVIGFNKGDIVLGTMPMFHSFGLTAGTLLPLLTGMKLVLYPNPLHYKVIPELVYDKNITILFGTSTFLAAYGRMAEPYDLAHSLRYVVAGAEKLKDEVRALWTDKFGIRILEGYGTTETSPVIALNTPMHASRGSVGRLLPGMEARVEPVDGIAEGGELFVRGPNVMQGYLIHGQGFVASPDWYRTGDVVTIDEQGFIRIVARLQSFAKIGGEKVSLPMVEGYVAAYMQSASLCAAVAAPDGRKGERIVVYHTDGGLTPGSVREALAQRQLPGIYMPSELRYVEKLPLLGNGKVDYVTLRGWAQRE